MQSSRLILRRRPGILMKLKYTSTAWMTALDLKQAQNQVRKKNAKNGAACNDNYYGKMKDDNRRNHVQFRQKRKLPRSCNSYCIYTNGVSHCFNSWSLHRHPNIIKTPKHCNNTRTLHQHPSIASKPEHCINNRTLHKHPKIASTPKNGKIIRTMHQHLNIESTPKHCINKQTSYNIASTLEHKLTLFSHFMYL